MSRLFDRLTVRPWRAQDIVEMSAIEQRAYPYPWSEGILRDCLHAGHLGWVASSRGEIISYAIVQSVLDEAHLLNLCTAPEWQGQGIGRGMLHYIMQHCAAGDMTRMLLEVRTSNTPAIALYVSSGFSQDGVRKGYYPASGGREDALLMSCKLHSGN